MRAFGPTAIARRWPSSGSLKAGALNEANLRPTRDLAGMRGACASTVGQEGPTTPTIGSLSGRVSERAGGIKPRRFSGVSTEA